MCDQKGRDFDQVTMQIHVPKDMPTLVRVYHYASLAKIQTHKESGISAKDDKLPFKVPNLEESGPLKLMQNNRILLAYRLATLLLWV